MYYMLVSIVLTILKERLLLLLLSVSSDLPAATHPTPHTSRRRTLDGRDAPAAVVRDYGRPADEVKRGAGPCCETNRQCAAPQRAAVVKTTDEEKRIDMRPGDFIYTACTVDTMAASLCSPGSRIRADLWMYRA